jgi:ubiquinone/menaquinone biosynthesis C-methylase UbiE
MKKEEHFFDFAAEVGLTKHMGGIDATEELIKRCHIDSGKYILDVGCGAGVTPCYIAKRVDCKVVGVDILSRMVERSRERAISENVADRVEFRVADAQDLPFEDNLFDAVICESVITIPEDKQQATAEFVRVTRPGGYVGLNESVWLKTPPPPEAVAWASQDLGACVKPLTSEGWVGLLQSAGLSEIVAKTYEIDVRNETKGILQRYGCGGMLTSLYRTFFLYLRNPAYRRFLKKIRSQGIVPENLDEYFGYGIFVGKKLPVQTPEY